MPQKSPAGWGGARGEREASGLHIEHMVGIAIIVVRSGSLGILILGLDLRLGDLARSLLIAPQGFCLGLGHGFDGFLGGGTGG